MCLGLIEAPEATRRAFKEMQPGDAATREANARAAIPPDQLYLRQSRL
jgi:hypothetical protein